MRHADRRLVLFLCRVNQAGAIMAEAILSHLGRCSPPIHFLITLCEVKSHHCPIPAEPAPLVCAHWSMPDPATVIGSAIDQQLAFEEAFATLHSRIRRFLALPLERLSDQALSAELTRIGETL